MTRTQRASRASLRLAALTILVSLVGVFASPNKGHATACDPTIFSPVPNCQAQQLPPVTYTWWESRDYVYTCTGDHPWFWGAVNSSHILNFTWLNSHFTVTENIFHADPRSWRGLITNWHFSTQEFVFVLGCSATPPPDTAICSGAGDPVGDPKCPIITQHTYCGSGPTPVCEVIPYEKCSNGDQYQCTGTAIGVTYCEKCPASATIKNIEKRE